MGSTPRDAVAETQLFLTQMDRQRAFMWKYRAYKEKITHYFLYRLSGDRMTAEDLSSELFLKTFQRFEEYDDRYAFSTWVYAIARNMLIDHLRARAHRITVPLEDAEHVASDEKHFFDAMDRMRDRNMLQRAMEQLPALQREAVYRKHILFLNTDEIAQSMGKTDTAVRQLVSRGCRTLQGLIAPENHPSWPA